jgi:hypothetical protein
MGGATPVLGGCLGLLSGQLRKIAHCNALVAPDHACLRVPLKVLAPARQGYHHGSMPKRILALGLDPAFADLSAMPQFTPELIRAFIDSQLARVRALGYEVDDCLVDSGATAVEAVSQRLQTQSFDCVMIGAGLRAPEHLLLFEKLLNLVHARAPGAKICFNTTPVDSAEAVQRWV